MLRPRQHSSNTRVFHTPHKKEIILILRKPTNVINLKTHDNREIPYFGRVITDKPLYLGEGPYEGTLELIDDFSRSLTPGVPGSVDVVHGYIIEGKVYVRVNPFGSSNPVMPNYGQERQVGDIFIKWSYVGKIETPALGWVNEEVGCNSRLKI